MMDALSVWWVWIILAALLGVIEMLAPSFMALGFAIGAVAVALLLALVPGLGLGLSLVVFALVALLAWIVLRRVVGLRQGQVKTFDHDIND